MVVRSIEAWHKQGTFEPKSWQQFIESYIHIYIYIYIYILYIYMCTFVSRSFKKEWVVV